MPNTLSVTAITGGIAAVGALGTAAYGLVDATKAFGGGLSNAGFAFVRRTIRGLLPATDSTKGDQTLLTTDSVLAELKASWLNGAALANQAAIAKSLIKLRLNADNATTLAEKAGVDSTVLKSVATKMAAGSELTDEEKSLTDREKDVWGRFDLILSTALDEAYQRADQRYRNWCKLAAIPVSMVLAVLGGWAIYSSGSDKAYYVANYLRDSLFLKSLIAGMLATPLAPVAKDLSTAVQAAAKAAQAIKG